MAHTAGQGEAARRGAGEGDATIQQQDSRPIRPVKTSRATKVYKNTNVTLR